jgi:arginine:ornithine antiporter/lysine permease
VSQETGQSGDNGPPAGNGTTAKLGLLAMMMLVVSAMFGSGVFSVPQNMAESAALGPILIAWAISVTGVFFLARSFQVLADVRPNMTSGIYMYSRAGFGKLTGFLIAWGYWMSACFGNVGYAVLLMDSLNYREDTPD